MFFPSSIYGICTIAIAAVLVVLCIILWIIRRRWLAKKQFLYDLSVLGPWRAANSSVSGTLQGNFLTVHRHDTDPTRTFEIQSHLLGRGGSAKVLIGSRRMLQKRRCAVKIISSQRLDVIKKFERERFILRDLDHPNIIRLHEVFPGRTSTVFILELSTGGHLGQVLRRESLGMFTEENARRYIHQLLQCIAYLHERGIAHRDIKLQNVLLESHKESAQIKLIDFGNSVYFRGQTPLTKLVGTTYTAAPEVFERSYDERCDLWSLGVVAFICLSGKRPFHHRKSVREATSPNGGGVAPTSPVSPECGDGARNIPDNRIQATVVSPAATSGSRTADVIQRILRGKYSFASPSWSRVSDEARSFITTCLERDYRLRPSASDLLNHPWITGTSPTHPFPMSHRRKLEKCEISMIKTRLTQILTSEKLYELVDECGPTIIPPPLPANSGTFRSPPLTSTSLLSASLGGGATAHRVSSLNSDGKVNFTPVNEIVIYWRQILQLAILPYLSSSRTDPVRAVFQYINLDESGLISRHEFVSFIAEIWPELPSSFRTLLFDTIDMDCTGTLCYSEFLASLIEWNLRTNEIHDAFIRLDRNRRGELSSEGIIAIHWVVPDKLQLRPIPKNPNINEWRTELNAALLDQRKLVEARVQKMFQYSNVSKRRRVVDFSGLLHLLSHNGEDDVSPQHIDDISLSASSIPSIAPRYAMHSREHSQMRSFRNSNVAEADSRGPLMSVRSRLGGLFNTSSVIPYENNGSEHEISSIHFRFQTSRSGVCMTTVDDQEPRASTLWERITSFLPSVQLKADPIHKLLADLDDNAAPRDVNDDNSFQHRSYSTRYKPLARTNSRVLSPAVQNSGRVIPLSSPALPISTVAVFENVEKANVELFVAMPSTETNLQTTLLTEQSSQALTPMKGDNGNDLSNLEAQRIPFPSLVADDLVVHDL